jgi:hypothetical protein
MKNKQLKILDNRYSSGHTGDMNNNTELDMDRIRMVNRNRLGSPKLLASAAGIKTDLAFPDLAEIAIRLQGTEPEPTKFDLAEGQGRR